MMDLHNMWRIRKLTETRIFSYGTFYDNTISNKKLFSSSLLLALGFLYTSICLNKIYYAEYCYYIFVM